MNHPKIEAEDFGSNCKLGACFLHLICFWFYIYVSLLFRACFHWYICLFIWLFSYFYIYIYIFFFFSFPFSPFVSVNVYASLCDFVCIALLLPFVLGFCLSIFGFFCIVFTTCYHWWICFLVWLLSFLFFFISFLNFLF